MHRRFLKPGGYAILTTPRVQTKTKLFYTLFPDIMNFAYGELMDVRQLGLYAYENGFEILRQGRIKAHNGRTARPRQSRRPAASHPACQRSISTSRGRAA